MMKRISTILIILLLVLSGYTQKVALVLSGGGAKATAHIGVLKALEENKIPVDYIIGNSMGALIAGLYASGYSPGQIEFSLTQPGLYDFRKGDTKQNYYFFQQHEDDASMLNIPFSFDKGLEMNLPINFYNVSDLDYLIMEYFASPAAACNYNFDSLMIPFRCVATDIDSSQLVVFRDGDLAMAVRSSLTFPFFIKPIKVDEKLLFDGGIYDNFPVNVARKEFNPDFIIGSKAVSNYSSPDEDDVVSQLQNMLMKKADFSLDSTKGVLIEINSGTENIFQFSKVPQYIDSGYAATIKMMPELKKRIRNRSDSASLLKKRKQLTSNEQRMKIGEVTVKGVNPKQAIYFKNSISKAGKHEQSKEFRKVYNRLVANENVRSVYPSLKYNPTTKKYDVSLDVNATDPFNIGFGGYISSTGVNEGYLDIGLRLLGKTSKKIDISTYFGTFYNSFGGYFKFEKPGTFPIDIKVGGLVSRKNYFSNTRYFFEDDFPAYIIIDENYVDLSIGIPVGLSHALRIGISNININYKYYHDNYFTRIDTADLSNFYFLNPFIEFERNNLNRKQYANKGSKFFLGFNYYAGNQHFTPGSTASGEEEFTKDIQFFTLKSSYEQYFKVSKPFDVGITGEFEYSNKPLLNNYVSSLLIADQYDPIPVMKTLFLQNYRANNYLGVGVKGIFHIIHNLDLRMEAYYYLPYQKIVSVDRSSGVDYGKALSNQYFLGNIQMLYYTPVGPLGVSVNYMDKEGDVFSFLFNFGYLIFNKSRFYR
jgi:NTE family protein